jgi:hypothetical protein
MNMARPRRPSIEEHLVREAAGIVRAETALTSAKAQSREIARRVVIELMADIDADDLEAAVAAVERRLIGETPFQQLASSPEVDTASLFVERRAKRLQARAGKYLTQCEQEAERRIISREIRELLSSRYDRHLRSRR